MKKRIWELDALRGICILGVMVVHFVFDVTVLYALVDWQLPDSFLFVQRWGGILFLLLSGICVNLGSHSVKRGIIVFGAGLLVSAATAGMYFADLATVDIIIYFGALHCLGVCMMLWPIFRKLPWPVLFAIGAVLIVSGAYLAICPPVNHPYFMPFGLPWSGFQTADYFPLLPYLGFFLMGAVLGKTLYKNKISLLPMVNEKALPIRFLCACGKHSLWIYLLHQPILNGICWLMASK